MDTQDFVKKLHKDQEKQEKNKKHGHGSPNKVLPTKQHGTNK
ncbi:DUF4023 family protein [Heyndrickxia sporothermodurans]|uniref:DUF4023 family protein n=1 Tax=Heyndrickxia sporothermodurans TaxID=46224 RepID=A0A150L6J3_9BACI|nr:DUF4023 family protein [Heyndrickxia sporothermodurans]KYD07895.1 hypothetical protein B4102_0529 [Heyndrickxia sporothermodurans]MBL5766916.1 DUF4023 family protein [Heyndrickxia sporothermodurans]MBL5770165.1 DUF4023 family protein [Heyndrickxia sporothermodurans]MBL5773801.1 DUF4023 family protein [Heyndrickxia sporothermodurans]MBL5777159.1 DUF4023 family protein [Heyndrickxia sporothermodurans]